MIFHNKDAKQQTVKTKRGDLWSSDFNSPDSDKILSLDAWLVKTKSDGLKVKNNNVVFNGKSIKLQINCLSENKCFNDFTIRLSNNIKKGTYQVIYRTETEDMAPTR